jgi:hypothetical protein
MKKRVAYLTMVQPKSPEYLHFDYFAAGAAAHGWQAFRCLNADDVRACDPDFVFVMHMTQPKVADYPHYGTVQYPPSTLRQVTNRMCFLSWDGYVTTSPYCQQWVEEMLHPLPLKPIKRVGRYYLAGHTQAFEENYALQKLVYAGVGWDERGIDLCRRLGAALGDQFEIYGNPHFWDQYKIPNFKGFIVSDELCAMYRRSVCLSISNPEYLAKDIITTRMHEAASVGGMTICPRTPETVGMYGDSLYYYNGFGTAEEQAAEIVAAYRECQANPATHTMRRAAHEWFNANFAQDVMFGHLLDFHAACEPLLMKESA